MKILCVNSIISEFGGAELSALNLAQGLADRGHEVHFLGACTQTGTGRELARYGDVHLHYRAFPRPYALGQKGSSLKKALWHLRDLADPANERTFAGVLKQIAPDVVILHNITGVGMNIWRTLRQHHTPTIQVIHDLGIICFNKGRFRSGRQCEGHCLPCRLQMQLRFSWLRGATRFSFVSPSHAILNEIGDYSPLSRWRGEVIPNPNDYITKPRSAPASQGARLLYVGRLDAPKGVEMMLRAAKRAREVVKFDFDVLGAGLLEQDLRSNYADSNWIRFHGSVDQVTIADFMSRATVLLVPSLWLENFPSVAVHALFAGLPMLASRIGGIPEIVEDGKTGRLLPPGDEDAWVAEIVRILTNRQEAGEWSVACVNAAQRFNSSATLDAYEKLLRELTERDPERRAPVSG